MPEREAFELPEPESEGIIEGIAKELGLDAKKKPSLFEGLPEERLFPEEAPTLDGRFIAGRCLEAIYDLVLRHTPSGSSLDVPILLSKGDVRWFHQEFGQAVRLTWQSAIPSEPPPDFTLTHLLGATKRQIGHLLELKRFHETEAFDPALSIYSRIGFVIEQAILIEGSGAQ
jgi:hypothetical protein